MRFKIYLSGLFIFLLILPQLTLGAGLVPCGGEGEAECTACDLLVLAQNIVKFVFEIIFVVVTVMLVAGGLIWITAGGKPERIAQGQKIMTNAIIGVVIVLVSWLIINTILWFFAGGDPGEWWKISCEPPVNNLPWLNQ